MRSICLAIVTGIAGRAARQGVTLDVSLSKMPARVIGFADPMYRAIERLVRNALDAMPQGGRLIVRVNRDPYVFVECADTGAERPASSSDEARATIEAHRGYVWHRRQPGGGTCVIVELPAAQG